MTKKRYDNLVSNDQSLKRIFSGLNVHKYPTFGKFMPSFSKQEVIYSADSNNIAQSDADLDLADQLINQTLISRDNTIPQDSTHGTQVAGRTKEILRNETADSLPDLESNVEIDAEADVESGAESRPESAPEFISNPELAELSKEIKEVSKESKEQREQALIKEKQQEINNLATEAVAPVAVSDKPVVVLPITAKSKEEAKFKTTKYSIKWLVEWCKKIAKMFSGAVVYKEEVDYE